MPSPRPLSVNVAGESVEVSVRRSDRARRVRLRVGEFGAEVVLPKRASFQHACNAVREHEDWLVKHLSKLKLKQASAAAHEGTLLFKGVRHESAELAAFAGVSVPRLETWMRRQAALALSESVARWATVMGVEPKRVSFRDQKTKWGACNARGTVTLNWRLVMAPPEVLDYVVVHELAHLKELNHSPRFWAIVERFCPDWRRHKKWLQVHGHLLSAR
ncbi:MAG: M48 family metallopeptidase [Armatimonadetes bacterium]|nr:M48 family metallopeptidase [Armatimonadota bacterium]